MPFPKNKTIKELGIDVSRKFVVVDSTRSYLINGDIVELVQDDNTDRLDFRRISDGKKQWLSLCQLDYADHPKWAETKSTMDKEKK